LGLDAWHERLELHFVSLAETRTPTGWPTFALEHGLSVEEIAQLRDDVRRAAIHTRPSDRFWLPWVVYAAEQGYTYEGDEYWYSFETSTPGWTDHGDRHWIRQRFVRFQQRFNGARPGGPWAEHFTIICWPITHAVLPRDLQQQLARVLYELRYSFSAELLRAPVQLGERIAAASYIATARFQRFAQDTHLVGHIATTLLLHDSAQQRLLPSALERIVRDLEAQQSAKEWLRSARQSARRRIEVHGLAGSGARKPERPSTGTPALDAAEPALTVEPRLRVVRKERNVWGVVLDVPDLSPLVAALPGLRSALSVARCLVSGGSRAIPRGALLWGRYELPLHALPSAADPLLTIEGQSNDVNVTLRPLIRFDRRPTRLFKLDTDDTGYELRGRSVLPGSRYVLITSDANLQGVGTPVQTPLAQTRAFEFEVPLLPGSTEVRDLKAVGFTIARRIDVWPAGVPVGVWSGDGECEWLCTEPLLLGVRADFELASLELSAQATDGTDVTVRLTPPPVGEVAYVRLAALSPGMMVCAIRAQSADGEGVEGTLRILVREPRPWSRGRPSNTLVTITARPAQPTMEQLWEGRAELDVRGAEGRAARLTISFEDGTKQLGVKRVAGVSLPLDARAWLETFDKEVRRDPRMQAAFDDARVCRVSVDVDDVGTATFEFEREFVPVRWKFRAASKTTVLRLINDSAAETVDVARYSFTDPLTRVAENAADLLHGVQPPEDGGLFVAETGNYRRGVVVPPLLRTFQDLSCRPRISIAGRSVSRVLELLACAQRWSTAHIPGGIAAVTRQRAVMEAIAEAIAEQLCGADWVRVERGTSSAGGSLHAMERLAGTISPRAEHRPIGQAIVRDATWYGTAPLAERVARFSTVTKRTLASSWPDAAVALEHPSEFVLRLASDPAGFLAWAGARAEPGVRALFNFTTYTRAARCLVLVVHRTLPPTAIRPDHIYEGWTWTSNK
jgi:hypothetical protein